MSECIKCEISDEKALLFDAISKGGIIKICRRCNSEENLPLVNQVKEDKGLERERNVYNRLSKYAKIDPVEHRKKFEAGGVRKEDPSEVEDKKLKDIVDKNFKKKVSEEKTAEQKREDLIYNFHWVIMRERRRKKLTQIQLAHELQESEQAIKMIEQGYVPEEGGNRLILKIENYLKINISKKPVAISNQTKYREIDPTKIQLERDFQKEANFDEITTKHLTISDLKKMKKEQGKAVSRSISESSGNEEFLDPFSDEPEVKSKKWWKRDKSHDEPDLSPEEIERIIYGE
jgi:ribosome-binding protein aMBF1 (putative translation factor)